MSSKQNPFPQADNPPPGHDPIKQPVDPNKIGDNPKNPNQVNQQMLSNDDKHSASGKQIDKVNAPIVSLNPTSGGQGEMAKDEGPKEGTDYFIVEDASSLLHKDENKEFKYPFHEIDTGQALFILVEKNMTTDKLMEDIHKQVYRYRESCAEIETDEKGDQVRESVVIETKKRTDDGVIQLDGSGKPIVGANQTNRFKMIHSANFIVRPVVKGDKITDSFEAEGDGVLVLRVL